MKEEHADNPEPTTTPETHPLRELFQHLVADAFQDTIGMAQREVSIYLGNLLTDFAHIDNLHRLRNVQGARLRTIAEMLMETDTQSENYSFDRERAVHKHIGDFTLFWVGVYPESLRELRAKGRADYLIDYVRQGKRSYHIVSTFQHGRYAEDANLFRQLSDEFELCLFGLSLVRREWERMTTRVRPAG